MCKNHQQRLTRRGFLVLSGAALGGAALACRAGPRLLELTAVPTPARATPQPHPTFTPSAVADTILVNCNIVTMDAQRAAAQAVAIKDGRILLVGDDQTVRNTAGERSQVIDLGGRTVTPGLIDAHCHMSACGLLGTAYVDISWPGVKTIPELQARVAEWIPKTPPGEWVVGSGWLSYAGRRPDMHDVDPVSPDHPVMLINQGGSLKNCLTRHGRCSILAARSTASLAKSH